MNITELMIGDWVNFCGNRYKVEYVDARGEEPHHRIALRNSEGYFIGHPGSVEPIPITFEILKKMILSNLLREIWELVNGFVRTWMMVLSRLGIRCYS